MSSPVTIRRSFILTFFLLLLSLAVITAAAGLLSPVQSDNPPQANSDSYCADPGNELKVTTAQGVLTNDTGTPLTIVGNSGPANGTLKLNADGSFSYTPKPGFTGTDTFSYTVSDSVQAFRMTPSVLANIGGVEVQGDGYGSSISPAPNVPNEFYGLTDRGPNVDGPNGSKVFPVPDFSPKIGHFKVENGVAQLLNTITLKDENGTPRSGRPNPPGPGNSGETGLDLTGKAVAFDPQGLDTEGLAALPDGTFWISDEYGPYMVHFDATGRTLEQITPFAKNAQNHKLPLVLSKRVPNRGMEGLTITPDGTTLVGMMQTSLINDITQAEAQRTTILRIVTLNLATGETHQYAYVLEDTITTGSLVSEITAVSNTEFLVDERDGKFPLDPATKPQVKKVWQISLAGATDISDPADSAKGLLVGGQTLEALVKTQTTAQALATLATNNIKPVTKTLKVDLIALLTALDPAGKFFAHDKIEGIALIDGGKKLVISDDSDFGIVSTSPVSFGVVSKTVPTTGALDYGEILIIDLAKLPARVSTATVTIIVGDTQPPVITAPANLTVVTPSPNSNCAVVNYSVTASDNCGTVTVASDSPSGTCFPVGVTTVTSTATDSAGNKSTSSFKVTVWDVSLQDDRSGDLLLFNSRTGDYSYTRCADGTKLTGKGVINRTGCQIALSNSQVSAVLDRCSYSATGRGRVAIRLTPFGSLLTINDSNTSDNSTACR
jgi:hypothetical protein